MKYLTDSTTSTGTQADYSGGAYPTHSTRQWTHIPSIEPEHGDNQSVYLVTHVPGMQPGEFDVVMRYRVDPFGQLDMRDLQNRFYCHYLVWQLASSELPEALEMLSDVLESSLQVSLVDNSEPAPTIAATMLETVERPQLTLDDE